MSALMRQAAQNRAALAENPYPGRGIVLGRSEDGQRLLQLYWIMGRSANSRNRRFIAAGHCLRTEALDPARMDHPELVIYNAMDEHDGQAVVTNGDHTDTVLSFLREGKDYRAALRTREREPDAPNFTPRIAGGLQIVPQAESISPAGWLAILKADPDDPSRTIRAFHEYAAFSAGLGWCLTTYAGDGEPLPSFEGEPRAFPLMGAPEQLAESTWELLNKAHRVALALKIITPGKGSTLQVINAREAL